MRLDFQYSIPVHAVLNKYTMCLPCLKYYGKPRSYNGDSHGGVPDFKAWDSSGDLVGKRTNEIVMNFR